MTDANDITVEPSAMDRFDIAGAMLLACGARSAVAVDQIDFGMLAGMWRSEERRVGKECRL